MGVNAFNYIQELVYPAYIRRMHDHNIYTGPMVSLVEVQKCRILNPRNFDEEQ